MNKNMNSSAYLNKAFESDVVNNQFPLPLDKNREENFLNNIQEERISNFEGKNVPNKTNNEKRQEWSKPIEFLLCCIAMSVGFGNVWRFPFTAYENGGGAFIIPYLVTLVLVGRPLYFLELNIGQFASSGPVKAWEMVPLFKGVGYGCVFASFSIITYYASIIAVVVFYLINSFQSTLPWTLCKNYTESVSCVNNSDENSGKSNAQLFYEHSVLNKLEDINDGIGNPQWELTLCLLVSWIVVLGTLIKGVKSSGKSAYVTAIFPYIGLVILLIRGATLEGAKDGIIYLLEPQWDKLLDVKVWYNAASQCFYSLGIAMGVLVSLGSYNKFNHNVYRDAMIISFLDLFTSLLAALTVFSILGHLAYKKNVKVSEVAVADVGLTFISYPEAIGLFEWTPQLFAVLFFLMLFILGIGSTVGMLSGVIALIADKFPKCANWKLASIVCTIGFLFGLVYVTPGGQFILTLVDHFGGAEIIYLMATLEIIGVIWIYGLQNFCDDIEFMLGKTISPFWKFLWGFFTPVLLIVVFIYASATKAQLLHEGKEYPNSAIICGWLLFSLIAFTFPAGAIYAIYKDSNSGIKNKIKSTLKPSPKWGPLDPKIWKDWREFKELKNRGKNNTIDTIRNIFNRNKVYSINSDNSSE